MIHDEEQYWQFIPTKSIEKLVYEHTELGGFYRVIDRATERIRFSDVNRIACVRDIDKVLSKEDTPELNKQKYLPILNDVLDKVAPISMPYARTEVIAYIEAFPGYNDTEDDVLGILYFRDKGFTPEQDHMISAKVFYRILPITSVCRFEEIDFDTYNEVKNKYLKRR